MIGQFSKDTLYTFAGRSIQLFCGIGTSIIIARHLGVEGKGIYSLAILFQTLLINLTDFGIGAASVFYIGRKTYSLKEVLGTNIIFSLGISVLAISVGAITIVFFKEKLFSGVENRYLYLALTLVPLWFVFNIAVNILLGLQRIGLYNITQLVVPFAFLISVTLFFLGHSLDVQTTIIAQVMAYCVAVIVLFYQIAKATGGIAFSSDIHMYRNFLTYGIQNYVGNMFSFVQYKVNIFMVNAYLGPSAVGLYSIAVGLSEQIWIISHSAGTVLFPRVAAERDPQRLKEFTPLVCRNILFILFVMAVALFAIGPGLIVMFYSSAFSGSVVPFQMLLIGAVAISAWRILANDLYGRGKPMLNTYVTGTAVIINIMLAVVLIPKFGILGAAGATSVSYTISLLIIAFVYSKISGNRIVDLLFIKKSDFKYYRGVLMWVKAGVARS